MGLTRETGSRFGSLSRHASPWAVAGAALVLIIVVVVLAFLNIRREERYTTRLMVERGEVLIRAFEAGTRTGMRGRFGPGVRFQALLDETSSLPGILFIAITDDTGRVLVHTDQSMVGRNLLDQQDIVRLGPERRPRWRMAEGKEGVKVFVVYRRFTPLLGMGRMRDMHQMMMRGRDEGFFPPGMEQRTGQEPVQDDEDCPGGDPCPTPEPGSPEGEVSRDAEKFIFVAMNPAPYEQAQAVDIRNTVVVSAVLLLLGFAGVVSLFWAQSARAARRMLLDSEAFAAQVVSSMPVGLAVTDRQGGILLLNEPAEALAGVKSAQVLGKTFAEVLPSEVAGLSEEAARNQVVVEREVEADFGRGPAPLSVTASRVRTEEGDLVGDLVILRDLSEVRRLEEDLRRKEKQAAVGRLAAGVAHEIRNPLSSIKGYASYFGSKFPEGSADRKSAAILVSEADRLNKAVTELLELSRPSEVVPVEGDLDQVAERAVSLARPDAEASGAEIVFEPGKVGTVPFDPDRLVQALLNLLLNAVEAGGSRVRVATSADRDCFRVLVQDDGPGIEPGELERIFDPYFTTKAKGTGLGLAVVRKIAEAHGGEVRAESEPGRGSSFTLVLPRTQDCKGSPLGENGKSSRRDGLDKA